MSSTALSPIDIEELIINRLSVLKDNQLIKRIYDTQSYSEIEEQSQVTPSIAVIYNGYKSSESTDMNRTQAVDFEYLVVIISRSQVNSIDSSGAKKEASALFSEVMKLLTGWKPAAGIKRLALSDAMGMGFSAGLCYIPIAYETRIVYTAQ